MKKYKDKLENKLQTKLKGAMIFPCLSSPIPSLVTTRPLITLEFGSLHLLDHGAYFDTEGNCKKR